MARPSEHMDYRTSILIEAERVFGDREKAAAWLSTPRVTFENRSGIQIASDRVGYNKVLEELVRLEHGFIN